MSKVKICGLISEKDIEAVNSALPDYIGFVFASSRRRVDFKTAALLKENLDPRIEVVGVFVNESIENVAYIYKNGIIGLVQLHGDEDDGYIRRLKNHCGCPVIKAVGVGGASPYLPIESDYLLFDTLSEQRGGTGKPFDWDKIKEYQGLPFFLSGGLSARNVADSVRMLAPYCVDVSSGVETDGRKDAYKIEEFITTARTQGTQGDTGGRFSCVP